MRADFKPRVISTEELREMKERGEDFRLLDVREEESCRRERIEGAECLPLEEIEEHYKELRRDQKIVVYCSSPMCPASHLAERKLSDLGFCALHYEEGIEGWRESGGNRACNGGVC
jgi:rhodanese-related sulfurtransferase